MIFIWLFLIGIILVLAAKLYPVISQGWIETCYKPPPFKLPEYEDDDE